MNSPSWGMNGWPPLSSRPFVRSSPSPPQPAFRMPSPKTASVRARRTVRPPGLVVRDELAGPLRQQPAPVQFGDRLLDEMDAAVGEADVHPTGVPAAGHRRGHEGAGGGAAHTERCPLQRAVKGPILQFIPTVSRGAAEEV